MRHQRTPVRKHPTAASLSLAIEEIKVAKCKAVMMYRESRDRRVRNTGLITRSRWKWVAATTIERVEVALKINVYS